MPILSWRPASFTREAATRPRAAAFAGALVSLPHAADPAAALRRLAAEPAWQDDTLALTQAPLWIAPDGLVVAGDATLDNIGQLRLTLGLPDAPPGALLAELYRRHGADAGAHALGMYGVVFWDPARRSLVLLRDGVGARTLYYTAPPHPDGATWFASRLSALRPVSSHQISLTALRAYLVFAYVPGAETMWRGLSEVRPGTAVSLPGGHTHTYWEPDECRAAHDEWDPDAPFEEHAARLRTLLEDAVAVGLPPSGPVGVYLSGGIDSSLVTALAARQAPGAVHTYAVHFGSEYPNELAFSGMVAQRCATQHHVLGLSARMMRDHLTETMAALDDPIGDPLTVPNLLLGRAAREHTDTVLNGEGGDPCFGGPKNLPMLLHSLYPSGAAGESRESAYLRSYHKCYEDLPRLLRSDVQASLAREAPLEAFVAPYLDGPHVSTFLNRLTSINVRLKGADHILTKVNNLTTANGLLGRSPLFDRRIVDASFAIPTAHKLVGTVEKAVLKRAVADLLPEPILTRPKSGMMVPVQRWFRRELRAFARDTMLGRQARIRHFANQQVVEEWLAFRGNLWPRHGAKLWLLLSLELWLRENGVS